MNEPRDVASRVRTIFRINAQPKPLPNIWVGTEATAGVGGKAPALQRRCRGAPLLRPPDAAVPAADAVVGRDERTLYQSYPGEAL